MAADTVLSKNANAFLLESVASRSRTSPSLLSSAVFLKPRTSTVLSPMSSSLIVARNVTAKNITPLSHFQVFTALTHCMHCNYRGTLLCVSEVEKGVRQNTLRFRKLKWCLQTSQATNHFVQLKLYNVFVAE